MRNGHKPSHKIRELAEIILRILAGRFGMIRQFKLLEGVCADVCRKSRMLRSTIMGKFLCTLIAGAGMILVGILPAWAPFAHWKWWIFAVALIALVSFVVQSTLQFIEDRRRKLDDRRRKLDDDEFRKVFVKAIKLLDITTESAEEPPIESNRAKSLGRHKTRDSAFVPPELTRDDPLVYLDIQPATESMFPRTPFILNNQGKSAAHDVSIQPFKLFHKLVTFPTIAVLPSGNKVPALATVEDSGTMTQHDIFYWLTKDWDSNDKLVEEWSVPISVKYSDPTGQRRFEVTMTLVFFPIRHMMNKKRDRPSLIGQSPTWEFREYETHVLTGLPSQ